MCLTALAWGVSTRYPLVLVANRDEFHHRASAPMDWWPDRQTLAGRDLEAGGTWLGLHRHGRLGLLTNVREPGRHEEGLVSRGHLVTRWLDPATTTEALRQDIQSRRFNGFNLLTLDLQQDQATCLSNRHPESTIAPGVHGLSNAAWNTPWPKVERLKAALAAQVQGPPGGGVDPWMPELLSLLTDRHQPADPDLPQTGLPMDRERELGRIFIRTADGRYGTRCSTVVVVERPDGGPLTMHAMEQSWTAEGEPGERRHHRVELAREAFSPACAS